MWSVIKSTINSNLSKPLNDLFNEQNLDVINLLDTKLNDISNSSNELGNIVNARYEISEDVLYSVEPFNCTIEKKYCRMLLIGKWVPKFDGFVKVKINASESASDSTDSYFGACQIPKNYLLEKFNSLNEIGDICDTAQSLADGQGFQTNNFFYYETFGSTITSKEINLPVKAGIPLKIYLHALYSSSSRTLTINECKVLGREVTY